MPSTRFPGATRVLVAWTVLFGTCYSAMANGGFERLEGGSFTMGSNEHYREEATERRVSVGPFMTKATEVTNGEFAAFVAATGYVNTAEKDLDPAANPNLPENLLVAGSMVLAEPASAVDMADSRNWWRYVPGANWRQPEGPGSSIEGLEDYPVVQVSPEDACAFALWKGGCLPTEAEGEIAARAGLEGAGYTWGEGYDPSQGWKANTWQGLFPNVDTKEDGHHGTAPVGSYPPNAYQLYEMAGNVWEHVSDWWVPGHPGKAQSDPKGPPEAFAANFAHPSVGAMHVVKGGSWLRSACWRALGRYRKQ